MELRTHLQEVEEEIEGQPLTAEAGQVWSQRFAEIQLVHKCLNQELQVAQEDTQLDEIPLQPMPKNLDHVFASASEPPKAPCSEATERILEHQK